MKLVSNDLKTFRDVFNGVGNIIDEIIIEVDNDGVRVDGLDKAHISFVSLKIDNDWFDEFYCDEVDKICVDAGELIKVLKRGKVDDTLILEVDNNDLVLIFDGESRRTFKIRLIDVTYESPMPPKLDYDVDFELSYNLLKDCVGDVSVYSDKIRLRVNNDKLFISGGGEFGCVDNEYLLGNNFDNDVSSVFAINRLNDMMKCNLNGFVGLRLGNDMPLSLYCVNDSEDIMISFILAPRIERE